MKFINWPSRCAKVKGHFVQTISLDLMKSSEVRKAEVIDLNFYKKIVNITGFFEF